MYVARCGYSDQSRQKPSKHHVGDLENPATLSRSSCVNYGSEAGEVACEAAKKLQRHEAYTRPMCTSQCTSDLTFPLRRIPKLVPGGSRAGHSCGYPCSRFPSRICFFRSSRFLHPRQDPRFPFVLLTSLYQYLCELVFRKRGILYCF